MSDITMSDIPIRAVEVARMKMAQSVRDLTEVRDTLIFDREYDDAAKIMMAVSIIESVLRD